MKKFAAAILIFGYLGSAASVLAQQFVIVTPTGVQVNITPPKFGIDPNISIGQLISNALTIVFIVAALLVLVYLIWGAFQWITSGGDKEGIGKARDKIIQSLVGLVILALAFLIVRVVGQIVNIDILNLPAIPPLGPAPR